MASAPVKLSPSAGGPIAWMVRMPPRTRVPARSVAPVKSSAMQPSSSCSGIGGEPGHCIRAKLQGRHLPQRLAMLGKEGRIARCLFEGGLIEYMQTGAPVKSGDLHLALVACQIGKPQHLVFSLAIGERRQAA